MAKGGKKRKERRRELFCSNFRASCAEKFEAKEKGGERGEKKKERKEGKEERKEEREKEKGERVFLPGGVSHERSATIKRLRPR